MEKFLTPELITQLARDFSLDERLIRTVLKVESAGAGFDENTGKIKIQFEPHIFKRINGEVIQNGVDVQTKEWIAFNEAFRIDPIAAMLSTSWGLMQVMGFNHEAAGYPDVGEMVDRFKESEYYQLAGGLYFIRNHKKMYQALKERDWKTFAMYYNGKNFAKYSYDTKLAKVWANLV